MSSIEDVIIIGSGPAGLTAAIYAARAHLNPLVIEGDEAGGQLMTTTDVENYPGFPKGVQGPEMMKILKDQAERFGTRFITRNVKSADLSKNPFELSIGKDIHKTRGIIVATGASAKYLGLESEKKFLGKGVSACATCDGFFFKDCDVCVVGGGDTAMEEALFLTRFAKKVFVIHRRDAFRASKIMAERVLSHDKIEVLWNTQLKEVLGDDKQVSAIKILQEGKEKKVPMEGVFIAIGHKPNTDVFSDQLETNKLGYIVTKGKGTQTSVEGVFACGDVQDHVYRQAVTAAGTGCMAAIDLERWLEAKKHS